MQNPRLFCARLRPYTIAVFLHRSLKNSMSKISTIQIYLQIFIKVPYKPKTHFEIKITTISDRDHAYKNQRCKSNVSGVPFPPESDSSTTTSIHN